MENGGGGHLGDSPKLFPITTLEKLELTEMVWRIRDAVSALGAVMFEA